MNYNALYNCPAVHLRLQGSGLFQWRVWLPVANLSVHGQLESSPSYRRPEGRPRDDGHGGTGEPPLSDPGFHSRLPGGVAPRFPGTTLTCTTHTSPLLMSRCLVKVCGKVLSTVHLNLTCKLFCKQAVVCWQTSACLFSQVNIRLMSFCWMSEMKSCRCQSVCWLLGN